MANYAALKTEWATLAGTVDQRLVLINAVTIPGVGTRDVSAETVFDLLLGTLEWGNIELMSRPNPTGVLGAVMNAADLNVAKLITFVRIVQSGMAIPTSNAAIGTALNSLLTQMVTAHLIAASTQTAIVALANAPAVPWWQANGFSGPINAGDIQTMQAQP